MKQFTLISLFLILTFHTIGNNAVLNDDSNGLPSVFNIKENTEGIITIVKSNQDKKLDFKGITVADIDKDNYNDILIAGDSSYSPPGGEGSTGLFNPRIYLIFGCPQFPRQVDLNKLTVKNALIRFHGPEAFKIVDIKTGDINGDGLVDIVFNNRHYLPLWKYSSKLFILYGRSNWYDHFDLDENSQELKRIYDFGRDWFQNYIYDYAITDLNEDRKDDIILPYYWVGRSSFRLIIYVIYGGQEFPYETELDNITTKLNYTKIKGDTANYEYGIRNITTGDFDNDHKPDIIIEGGYYKNSYRNPPLLGITHIIYDEALDYKRSEPEWSIIDRVTGLVKIKHNADSLNSLEVLQEVGSGDITGDGFDDLVIGYPKDVVLNWKEEYYKTLYAEIFVLFGREQFLMIR